MTNELISKRNRMNVSAFQDLSARVTINPGMHEQVHTMFYLLYIQQTLVLRVVRTRILQFLGLLFFQSPMFAKPGLRSFLSVLNLFFAFSSSCSTMFWFYKALSAIFFFIWCSNLALPQCFHDNFRIALYNLYLHSITCATQGPGRNQYNIWKDRVEYLRWLHFVDKNGCYSPHFKDGGKTFGLIMSDESEKHVYVSVDWT